MRAARRPERAAFSLPVNRPQRSPILPPSHIPIFLDFFFFVFVFCWGDGGYELLEGEKEGGRERKGRGTGGKVLNRVCRLVNITLTRSVAAPGVLFTSTLFSIS